MNTILNNMNKQTKQNQVSVEQNKIQLIKIAIDMHLRSFRVVRQLDHALVQPAQRFEPAGFYRWLEKEKEKAERVAVCYEAGCFGYEPARRMEALGVEVYVIAPQNWDEQGKRQVNDKWDAAVMCRRLSDYLEGHRKALSEVHIPTRQEEAKRAEGRFREQLCNEIRRLGAMGRSLLLQREMAVRGRWWRGSTWKRITQAMPSWVVHQLEVWKEVLEKLEKRVSQEEAKLQRDCAAELVLFGEGRLSHVLLQRELINSHRFKNGRQVGNYFGLCPSESTTGDNRRLGAITKHGNPRLRRMMVELAWRVVHFQPQYVGLGRWRSVLLQGKALGGAARKKAIVAVARRLAVDLWRIAIGRKKPEELGLRVKVS
jgi:transposase